MTNFSHLVQRRPKNTKKKKTMVMLHLLPRRRLLSPSLSFLRRSLLRNNAKPSLVKLTLLMNKRWKTRLQVMFPIAKLLLLLRKQFKPPPRKPKRLLPLTALNK